MGKATQAPERAMGVWELGWVGKNKLGKVWGSGWEAGKAAAMHTGVVGSNCPARLSQWESGSTVWEQWYTIVCFAWGRVQGRFLSGWQWGIRIVVVG